MHSGEGGVIYPEGIAHHKCVKGADEGKRWIKGL